MTEHEEQQLPTLRTAIVQRKRSSILTQLRRERTPEGMVSTIGEV